MLSFQLSNLLSYFKLLKKCLYKEKEGKKKKKKIGKIIPFIFLGINRPENLRTKRRT